MIGFEDQGEIKLIRLHRKDCFCNYQFNVKACSVQGIFKTSDVVKNDPDSMACPANTIELLSMCVSLLSYTQI